MMVSHNGWVRRSVTDVCETIVDCVNKTAPTVDYETPYKMIRTTNVRDGWVNTSAVRYVTEQTFHRWTRRGAPRRGDVILSREAPLGEVGLLRSDEPILLGQRLMMYRADPSQIDNRFLAYSFLSHDVQAQIHSFGSGATVQHMRVPDCSELTLSVPPLAEQRRIADILSAYDDLIENNTRRITLVEEMARAIYGEWFVHFRYPGHDSVSLIDSPLGQIPEEWEVVQLGQFICERRERVRPGEVAEGLPYVGLEHIPRHSLALAEWDEARDAQSTKSGFHAGDILFGKIRPYFHKVAVAPVAGICSTDILVLVPQEAINTAFATQIVFSDEFVNLASQTSQGTKMPRADWKVLNRHGVVYPPNPIRAAFQNMVGPMLELAMSLIHTNRALQQTRDLLLPRLISGRLSPSTGYEVGAKALLA